MNSYLPVAIRPLQKGSWACGRRKRKRAANALNCKLKIRGYFPLRVKTVSPQLSGLANKNAADTIETGKDSAEDLYTY